MTTSKKFLSLAALLTLSAAAEAQTAFFNNALLSSNSWTIFIPPTLPPVQSRFNSYDRTIGNSWLGGSVHAYAGMVRQKQGTYELGNVTLEFRGTANVLQQGREVVEIVGTATNIMNNGVQNRSGLFRFEVLGYPLINTSFANNSTFAQSSSSFNLFPGNGISVSVPVGPVSVTIAGNAGCGYGRSANWLLPAATASVGLNASANAYAFANASVSFGIPGFNVGVGLQGRILEQVVGGNVTASANSGLSGGMTYQLNAITLTLYAWATAIWTWTTNLTSWSAGLINVTLL